jgi:rhamnulokinase
MTTSYLAVDIGASSGRILRGALHSDRLHVEEVRRFPTRSLELPDGLHWDVGHLSHEILGGIADAVGAGGDLATISFDTWGVDYALVSDTGAVLGFPFSHRDARTRGMTAGLDDEFLFEATGIQTQEINTLVQLLAEPRGGALDAAEHVLFLPDLLAFSLTGIRGTDRTIASTSQLLDARGTPAHTVAARYGLPDLLPPVSPTGSVLGGVRANVTETTGFGGDVILGAGHDTACAVAAIPAESADFAFISCGTWGLVGFELPAPQLSSSARTLGFTNEHGVDGTYRFLRNVTGLWLLNESLRAWGLPVSGASAAELVMAAQSLPRFASIIDPLDPVFLPPGDMPERIAGFCGRTGQGVPVGAAQVTRCIIDSLALSFADTIVAGARIAGVDPRVVHMVGGGSAIADLCAAVADLTGLPVVAGPIEATGLGNLLIQARARGDIDSLASARAIVRATTPLVRHEPGAGRGTASAIDRFHELVAKREVL